LKGGDFFSVSEFPSAQLEILKYDGINLTGDLTIKEITKEITFPATISVNNTEVRGQANFTINRTDFGVVYGSGNFFDLAKDQVISDEILFDVSIKAIN
jgi:polyisoprenoid-binding protein YceI